MIRMWPISVVNCVTRPFYCQSSPERATNNQYRGFVVHFGPFCPYTAYATPRQSTIVLTYFFWDPSCNFCHKRLGTSVQGESWGSRVRPKLGTHSHFEGLWHFLATTARMRCPATPPEHNLVRPLFFGPILQRFSQKTGH